MTQTESDRADKITELKRLGVEFEGQTAGRVQQWADELEYATVDQVRRAVQKMLDDPTRRFLPRIGEIKAIIPRPDYGDGLEAKLQRGQAFICDPQTGTWRGDPGCISAEKRKRQAASILRVWHPKSRERSPFWPAVRDLALMLDPDAFGAEAQASQKAMRLDEPKDPFAEDAA